MKKYLYLILAIIIIGYLTTKTNNLVIPKDAIRLRVIANSNNPSDQLLKNTVRNNLQSEVYDLLKDTSNIKAARKILYDNLPKFNNTIQQTLDTLNSETKFSINFGENYFPKKVYKGVTYDDGYYESLVVTLGKGNGDNWWCVLFPPLCLLEAEETSTTTEVEYKFFVQEIIDKIFKN